MSTQKTQLRKVMKSRRAALDPEEVRRCSQRIVTRVLAQKQVLMAKSVFVFISVRNEPQTRGLIQTLIEAGKRVSVPRINSQDQMHAHVIQDMDDLRPASPSSTASPCPRPIHR